MDKETGKGRERMTAAPQIAAGVHARWPDEQMVLAKAGVGMSFAEKYKTMREKNGKILETGEENK